MVQPDSRDTWAYLESSDLRFAFENKKLGATLLLSLLAHVSAAILFCQVRDSQLAIRAHGGNTAGSWLEVSTTRPQKTPHRISRMQSKSRSTTPHGLTHGPTREPTHTPTHPPHDSLSLPTNSAPDGFANDSALRVDGTNGGARDSAVSASTLGININYPHLSRVLREEGVVLVELDISGSSARLLKSSGHQRLDTAALASLKNFKPAISQTRIVEFEFKLR